MESGWAKKDGIVGEAEVKISFQLRWELAPGTLESNFWVTIVLMCCNSACLSLTRIDCVSRAA